jgi:hypothetical protein
LHPHRSLKPHRHEKSSPLEALPTKPTTTLDLEVFPRFAHNAVKAAQSPCNPYSALPFLDFHILIDHPISLLSKDVPPKRVLKYFHSLCIHLISIPVLSTDLIEIGFPSEVD